MATTTASLRDQRRTDAPSYEPTPEEEEALRFLNNAYDPESPERLALERQWSINIAFLRGYVYHRFDEATRMMMFRPIQKRWRAYSNRNHIRSYVDRRIATLTGPTPEFIVNPANDDEDSYLIAEVGKKLLNHEWSRAEMDLLEQDLFYWSEVTGNGFLKTIFNMRGGEAFADDQLAFDEDGNQVPTQTVMYEGDLEHEVVPTFAIHTQPYITHPSEMDWIVEERYRPIEWVERNFPDRASQVPMGAPRTQAGKTRRSLIDFASPAGIFSSADTKASKNYCFIREMWAKPSMDYPAGRLIIAADDMILRVGDNPAPDHAIPYRWFRNLIIPGTAWADCNVTHMISPQKDLNRLVSQHVEHIVLTGRAKVLEHSTNKLQDGAFRTEIGDTVLWNGMQPPSYLEPPAMSGEIDNEIQRCSQHFDSMTGQYGPARGQYQGKMSGRAIDILVEMDQKSEEPLTKRIGSELQAWGAMTLKWMRDYVTSERTVKIVGKANELSVISFQGADLEHATDVTIDLDSITPKSKTFALTMIQQLAQVGMLNPASPEDRQRAWKMLALRGDDQVVGDKTRDMRDAGLENRMMLLGMPVEPAQWYQDSDAHYLKHTEAMKSDAFKKAPPIVKQWFFVHMESHRVLTIPKVGVTLAPEDTMAEGPAPKNGAGGGGPPPKPNNATPPQPGGFQ